MNAREALSGVLSTTLTATEHASGGYLAAEDIQLPIITTMVDLANKNLILNKWPLSHDRVCALIELCKRSAVGTQDAAVMELSVRNSWELLPCSMAISNKAAFHATILQPILREVAARFELSGWEVRQRPIL